MVHMDDILDSIRQQVERIPEKPALCEAETCLTYAQLDAMSSALAQRFRDEGLNPGDVVGCLKRTMTADFLCLLACLKSGMVHLVLDDREADARILAVFSQADPKLMLVETDEAEAQARQMDCSVVRLSDIDLNGAVQRVSVNLPDTAPCWYEATSGSTGSPKLVINSRRWLQHLTAAQTQAANLSDADVVAVFGELWCDTLLSGLTVGATVHAYDLRGRGAAPLEDWMRRTGVTAMQTYVAAFRALADAVRKPLPDLRIIRLAGEVILPRDVIAFHRICMPGAALANYYGATECGFMTQHIHRHGDTVPEKALAIGRPVPGTEIVLVDEVKRPVPQGATGLILYKAPFLADGYLNDPERTAQTYWTDPDGRAVVNTGDLGVCDRNGVYRVVGRADDQVKIRGYAVRYSEVEALLGRHPAVEKVAVTSFMSPRAQRQLSAHIIPAANQDFDPRALKAWLAEHAPAYMVPNYYTEHAEFPKTDTGKVLRRALPNPLNDMEKAAGIALPDDATRRAVAAAWKKVLGHDAFGIDEDFFDVGGDSLQAMAMVVDLEQRLNVRIGYESLIMRGASIESIAQRIDAAGDLADRILTLKKGDGQLPIFVTPVENGEFSDWLHVIDSFPAELTLLGVHVRDLRARKGFPALRVEDLARYAADSIEEAAPEGPFVVAGFSAGSQIAFEIARILENRGRAPAGLILLDPPLKSHDPERKTWHLRRIASALLKSGNPALSLNRAAHILMGRPARELPVADERAYWSYQPKPLTVPKALLIFAQDDNPHRAEQERLWCGLLRAKTEVADTPGDHNAIVRDVNAPHLAGLLACWWHSLRTATAHLPAAQIVQFPAQAETDEDRDDTQMRRSGHRRN